MIFNLDDLIVAIFERAKADLKYNDLRGNSARVFLAPSGWARFLLESMGVDPDVVSSVGNLVE